MSEMLVDEDDDSPAVSAFSDDDMPPLVNLTSDNSSSEEFEYASDYSEDSVDAEAQRIHFRRDISHALDDMINNGNMQALADLQLSSGRNPMFQEVFEQIMVELKSPFDDTSLEEETQESSPTPPMSIEASRNKKNRVSERKPKTRVPLKSKTRQKIKKSIKEAEIANIQPVVADEFLAATQQLAITDNQVEDKEPAALRMERCAKCPDMVDLSLPYWHTSCSTKHESVYHDHCVNISMKHQLRHEYPVKCALPDCEGYVIASKRFRIRKSKLVCGEKYNKYQIPGSPVDQSVVVPPKEGKSKAVKRVKKVSSPPIPPSQCEASAKGENETRDMKLEAAIYNPNVESIVPLREADKVDEKEQTKPKETKTISEALELARTLFDSSRRAQISRQNFHEPQTPRSLPLERALRRAPVVPQTLPTVVPKTLSKAALKNKRRAERRKLRSIVNAYKDRDLECSICCSDEAIPEFDRRFLRSCECKYAYHEACINQWRGRSEEVQKNIRYFRCPLCSKLAQEADIIDMNGQSQSSAGALDQDDQVAEIVASKWTCPICTAENIDVDKYIILLSQENDAMSSRCQTCLEVCALRA